MLLKYLPEEKVIRTVDTANEPGERDDGGGMLEALEKAGFDTDSSMRYCQDDIDIYRSVLSEFASEYVRKSVELKSCHDSGKWEDYSILIHSVKSSAKTIGANDLSEHAAGLEKASKEMDEAYIEKEHGITMNMYEQVCTVIRSIVDVPEPDDGSDDEVLEFAPDGD